MLPACSNGAGQASSLPPDICKNPPNGVPAPYPNMGMMAQAAGFSTKVMFVSRPAVHLMSQIPMSTGDSAGAMGGVTSGVIMSTVQFSQGSSKVFIEGNACEMLTASTKHNQMNTVGAVSAPSQDKVFVVA